MRIRAITNTQCSLLHVQQNLWFWLIVSGHRQQDDITEPGHHIWAEPAAQAEELREGVQRPELGPYGGQRRHHRRRPAHDRHAPNPFHGRSADLLT